MKDYGLTTYERETLTALYKSLTYMKEEGLDSASVVAAIMHIEAKAKD